MNRQASANPPTLVPTAKPVAEMDRLGDEIALLSAHLEAATARLLDLIREFDARGGWNRGFRSCAHWLSWRVGLDLGAARERVRVARALSSLRLLAEALARGELSYAKVRALTRIATPGDRSAVADPVGALKAQHDAQGLHLHARTTCPGWLGERLDVGWAIDVLHPLARRGA